MLDLDAANTPVSAAGDGAGLDVVDYQRRPVARQGATAVTVGGLALGAAMRAAKLSRKALLDRPDAR